MSSRTGARLVAPAAALSEGIPPGGVRLRMQTTPHAGWCATLYPLYPVYPTRSWIPQSESRVKRLGIYPERQTTPGPKTWDLG